MAIVKSFGGFSPGSRDSILSDDDELQTGSSVSDSDGDEDADGNDVDSGMGSDDRDLLELGQIGKEFCRVGDQNCLVPYELYDLPDLSSVLSLDTWNECLTEGERFRLAEFLPDMDQETFNLTVKELLSGSNFHFGSPLMDLFNRLKGGLCESSVAGYQQGLNFMEKHRHYHALCRYQNSLVRSLIQMRDAWENCVGYGIEERIRILNLVRSRRSLICERDGGLGSETESSAREESGDGFWIRSKDGKVGAKTGKKAFYPVKLSLDASSRGRPVTLDPVKYGKPNPRGVLKVAAPKASSKEYAEALGCFPSVNYGLEQKSRPHVPLLALPRQHGIVGHDLENVHQNRSLRRDDDEDGEQEHAYGVSSQFKRNMIRDSTGAGFSSSRARKKPDFVKKYDAGSLFRLHKEDAESHMGLPLSEKNDNHHTHRSGQNVEQVAHLEPWTEKRAKFRSYDYHSQDAGKKVRYPAKLQKSWVEDRRNLAKDRAGHLLLKGNAVDWSAGRKHVHHNKTKEAFAVSRSIQSDEWNVRSNKWKMGKDFQAGKASMGKIRGNSAPCREVNAEDLRGMSMHSQSEETESDSSEQFEGDEEIDPSTRKSAYSSGVFQGVQSSLFRSVADPKKAAKVARKDRERGIQVPGGTMHSYVKIDDLSEQLSVPELEIFSSEGKHKGKKNAHSTMCERGSEKLKGKSFSSSANLVNDHKPIDISTMNGQTQGQTPKVTVERSTLSSLKSDSMEKKRKANPQLVYSVQSNHIPECDSRVLKEDNLHVLPKSTAIGVRNNNRLGKKTQNAEDHITEADHQPFQVHNSVSRKRKGKANLTHLDGPEGSNSLHSNSTQPINDLNIAKQRGKKREVGSGHLPTATSNVIISEMGAVAAEHETKPPMKPFTLITPSIHTGFSFSIVHLLSAVRIAMITLPAEDVSEAGKYPENNGGQKPRSGEQSGRLDGFNGICPSHANSVMNSSEQSVQKNLPSLTIQEIVNCVRSNPGDPCILETQEPLHDLVRGVLKIFSSKTAPLGAKGWKALVLYEKPTKSWSWVGPISSSSPEHDSIEEVTSSEAWGVPHKMLVKLVDAFANWLKSGQETLQQIGSLPPPPMSLMLPELDEKERFKDLRAQKSLNTISPSSDEVRAYFRREELLRYSIPDRAFSYTASDGRKSTVAPLRRCGGKPTSKAREHFMLKTDRPPHVTILCLVRDAAARLPGSIGTRADVCTLLRDSQYIVEDVTDAQVNQIVSGALDRLHYERDPCVFFDGERKLWVYLHRDREEEDFEDDGTSSTKKWKRQRKDTTEQSDLGAVNDAGFRGAGDQVAASSTTGYDFSSGPNIESSSMYVEEKSELVYNNLRSNMEENLEPFIGSTQGSLHQSHPMGWEVLDLNTLRESKMLCQENSTNEDFDDDETFSKERQMGL